MEHPHIHSDSTEVVEDSPMEVDQRQEDQQKEEEDPFLNFVDQARLELLSLEDDSNRDDSNSTGYGWSWMVSRILKTCVTYSSGVTPAILLSELSQVHHLNSSFYASVSIDGSAVMSFAHELRNALIMDYYVIFFVHELLNA